MPQPAIARIESGSVSPQLRTMDQLLAAAGFSLEVAPRIGEGVDRSLIRGARNRSPEDRIRAATEAARMLREYLDAAHQDAVHGPAR